MRWQPWAGLLACSLARGTAAAAVGGGAARGTAYSRRVGVRCENATGNSGRCDEGTVKARQSRRCLRRRRVAYANCIPWAADTVLSCGARPTSRKSLGELQMYGYGAVLFLTTPPLPLPRTHAGRILSIDCPCSARMHVQGSITQGRLGSVLTHLTCARTHVAPRLRLHCHSSSGRSLV